MGLESARKAGAGLLLATALFVHTAIPAAAQENCTGFSWPLETELSWMASASSELAESGAKLASLPDKAITLKLKPAKDAALPVKPGKKKQAIAPDSYSGWFEIAGLPESGLYQVTLSQNGWIDVAQNGELLQSQGFTGVRECQAIRKSVRFNLGAGPVLVEISGAPAETVKVTVRAAK